MDQGMEASVWLYKKAVTILAGPLVIAVLAWVFLYWLIVKPDYEHFNSLFKGKYVVSTIQETGLFQDLSYHPTGGFTHDEIRDLLQHLGRQNIEGVVFIGGKNKEPAVECLVFGMNLVLRCPPNPDTQHSGRIPPRTRPGAEAGYFERCGTAAAGVPDAFFRLPSHALSRHRNTGTGGPDSRNMWNCCGRRGIF